MLKFSACSENTKKACWKFQYVLKTVKKSMLKISECSENCKKACWKFQDVLKTVTHVVCLKFQRMLKTNAHSKLCWILQGMLKTIICVENCWNSMLKISACVENCNACRKLCQNFKVFWKCLCKVCWKPYRKPCWSTKKTPSHFTACVEIEWQISFFSFGFACVSEVRHICVNKISNSLISALFHEQDHLVLSNSSWQ